MVRPGSYRTWRSCNCSSLCLLQRRIKALKDGYSEARQAVRVANGLKVLLDVLSQSSCKDPQRAFATLKLRCYAVQALQGLAQDASICHTLQNLQASFQPSAITEILILAIATLIDDIRKTLAIHVSAATAKWCLQSFNLLCPACTLVGFPWKKSERGR